MFMIVLSYLLLILTLPFSLIFCVKVIAEYERAVIFRLGRILPNGARGPGLFFVLPCLDIIRKVDLRTVTFDVPPQEVLTKDSVTVAVDAVVYYRIYNPVVAVTNVEDADRSTRLLAATTLRNVLGTRSLSEILAERESISGSMQSMLDDATDPWGVKVERVEVWQNLEKRRVLQMATWGSEEGTSMPFYVEQGFETSEKWDQGLILLFFSSSSSSTPPPPPIFLLLLLPSSSSSSFFFFF
nr:unnamed protein product [Spirometra erinaceieuropaei]